MLALAIFATIAAPSSVSIYGIAIGQPLSIPECRAKPPSESDQRIAKRLAKRGLTNFLDSPFPAYEPASGGPCYKRLSKTLLGTPISTEKVHIAFPIGERLAGNDGWDVAVQMVGGRVEYLKFRTRGRAWQDEDLATFNQKFGAPLIVTPITLQNGFGAKYEALKATWQPGAGIVATFESWVSDTGGTFGIGTPEAEQLFWQMPTLPAKPL